MEPLALSMDIDTLAGAAGASRRLSGAKVSDYGLTFLNPNDYSILQNELDGTSALIM
jgi:hypothetical protein